MPDVGRALLVAELLGSEGVTREHATFDMPALRVAAYERAPGLVPPAEVERALADLLRDTDVVEVALASGRRGRSAGLSGGAHVGDARTPAVWMRRCSLPAEHTSRRRARRKPHSPAWSRRPCCAVRFGSPTSSGRPWIGSSAARSPP